MDPETGYVLYQSDTQRNKIIRYWLRNNNILESTPIDVMYLFIMFSNNPYKNRFKFKINEEIGYIRPEDNYIVNGKIIHSVIGCRIQLEVNEDNNAIYHVTSIDDIHFDTFIWLQLPNNNIVPPIKFTKQYSKYDGDENEIGLDDGDEYVVFITSDKIEFKVPPKYARISRFYITLLEGDYCDSVEFRRVNSWYMSLIIKYIFHCKGNRNKLNMKMECLDQYQSLKDIVSDEWILEFINIINQMKDGIVGVLRGASYMDIDSLWKLCSLKIIFNMKGKPKQEIIGYFDKIEMSSNTIKDDTVIMALIQRWSDE